MSKLNTQALVALGLKQNGRKQNVCEAVIYPMDVLNPYNSATGKLEKTENTFSIHWYEATWMSKHLKIHWHDNKTNTQNIWCRCLSEVPQMKKEIANCVSCFRIRWSRKKSYRVIKCI